jgi:hypothetical protein
MSKDEAEIRHTGCEGCKIFATGMNHVLQVLRTELRDCLTALLATAAMADDSPFLDEKLRRELANIRALSERAAKVVADLESANAVTQATFARLFTRSSGRPHPPGSA